MTGSRLGFERRVIELHQVLGVRSDGARRPCRCVPTGVSNGDRRLTLHGVSVSPPTETAVVAPDPRVGDRRRPGAARPVRSAAGDLRGLHRVGPVRWASSRTSSATRCCRGTPTPTRSPAGPACRPRGCARTPARIIRDAVGGDDDTVVIFAGSGCTGAIDKLIGILGLRIPAELDDRYHLRGRDSCRRSGRWCTSARSSTTRTSCRGVSRSPTW